MFKCFCLFIFFVGVLVVGLVNEDPALEKRMMNLSCGTAVWKKDAIYCSGWFS